MGIVPRADCGQEEWDAIVHASPEGWVWALWEWQELILAVPRWQLVDASIAVHDNGRVVSVVPLQWSGDRRRLSGSGWGLTPPLFAAEIGPEAQQRYAERIFEHVKALAIDGGASRVEFGASAASRASLASPARPNPFVDFGYADRPSATRVLDLRPDEDALFMQLSKDARQQIKKARASGVTVQRVRWVDYLAQYYALHSETYLRTGEQPHPREFFEGIATRTGESGYSILWCAFGADGQPMAFHNTARFATGAMYHTGCSSEAALNAGANYLVFWEAMCGAKRDGCLAYEIGEVFLGDVSGKKLGLRTFKSKFGGEVRPVIRASLEIEAPTTAEAIEPPPAADGTDVDDAFRELLRFSRRMAVSVAGPRAGNAVARVAVRTLTAIRSAPQTAGAVAEGVAQAVAQNKRRLSRRLAGDVRFIRPFWNGAEDRAAERGLSVTEDPVALEQRIAARMRDIEDLPRGTSILLTSSGRGALQAALQILSEQHPRRQHVVVQSYSCKGLFDAIVGAGLTPRFADVNGQLLADSHDIRSLAGDDVLAVILVHLAGRRFDDQPLVAELRQRGIYVVEDRAHAFGAGWPVFGDAVIYSFGLGKNVTATAGGAVVSRVFLEQFEGLRPRLADEGRGRAWRRYQYCRTHYFSDVFGVPGYADDIRPDYGLTRIAGVDAALLEAQLSKTNDIVCGRQSNARQIVAALQHYPQVFTLQDTCDHVYTKLTVHLPREGDMARFLTFMTANGVELEWMYTPLHLREFGRAFATRALPRTDRLEGTVLNVPVRPNLTRRQVLRIAELIREFAETAASTA